MTNRRFSSQRYVRVAGLVFALAALMIYMAKNMPGLSGWLAHARTSTHQQASSRFAEQSKESLVARMTELDALITSIKVRLSSHVKDQELLANLNAAQTEYDQISEYMGGDRAEPTGTVPSPSRVAALKHAIANLKKQLADDPDNEAVRNRLNALTASLGGDAAARAGEIRQMREAPALVGCSVTTTSFSNNTPVAIPTGPAVVTSTITVSGLGPYLADVDITTFIQHTFAADLDITIQSPAGTVVTLTTDNGAGNDNVFNGTVWDDDANPGGQVPYATNNGLVTDHAYVNLTLASPLVPEEALAAFIGENPNGTWTITISDDLAGDGGSLDSWSLDLDVIPNAPIASTMSFANNTPVAIPTGPAVVSSTVNVSGAGTTISKVTLLTNITHTFAADLDITLLSPAGTIVTLTTDNGAGNDNVFNGTLWDDDANPGGQVPYATNNGLVTDHAYVNLTLASPLVPEEHMGAFINEDPNGTWTITISDDLAGDGGSLDSWTLNITTATCVLPCSINCPANITTPNDPNQCGALVTYPAPTTTGTCGTVTCSPASGAFFPVGTTTTNCTSTAGPSCTFTVTVNDTQAPTITCPANITAIGPPGSPTVVITYPPPTASDNCPGVTAACVPPSGSSVPVGTTTVTCTATDATGNTASCSFTVNTFDGRLQDNSAGCNAVVLFNSFTGAYQFCCGGIVYTGTAKVTKKANVVTLEENSPGRRVLIKVDNSAHAGTASLQSPPGTTKCTISDSNTTNDTCSCP